MPLSKVLCLVRESISASTLSSGWGADEKLCECHPRIPFLLLSYFLLCLLYVCSYNHCAIKTYIQPVAFYTQLNG